MIVLKFLFKFVKLLNSETSTRSLAFAFALGMALGLVPFLSPQGAGLLCVVLFLRVNLTTTLVSFGIFRLLALAFTGALDAAGTGLLASEGLRGLWAGLDGAGLLAAFSLNHSVSLTGTLAAGLLFAPAFFGFRAFVRFYRVRLRERVAKSRALAFFKGLKIVRLYRLVTTPLG